MTGPAKRVSTPCRHHLHSEIDANVLTGVIDTSNHQRNESPDLADRIQNSVIHLLFDADPAMADAGRVCIKTLYSLFEEDLSDVVQADHWT